MDKNPLGKNQAYDQPYSAELLFVIPRSENRLQWSDNNTLPFSGYDLWRAYEFSWLNEQGKPQASILQLRIPADSENIVESKSIKLYLNSFNLTTFKSESHVIDCLFRDISSAVNHAGISLDLFSLSDPVNQLSIESLQGICLDKIECEEPVFSVEKTHLKTESSEQVKESLYSHLFRSLCPVTGQPDWASVWIHYEGQKIERSGLLKYLLSYRTHQGFHEDCVESMFMDVMEVLKPEKLSIAAYFTRRGGIDINPFRSSFEKQMPEIRLSRQ
jgi:7-cyano-7-deazaguanine reductase